MKLSTPWLYLAAVVLLCGTTLIACEGVPQEKIDDKVVNDLIANISANRYLCEKGCRDFKVTCTRSEKISRADQLNGVTERILIGMRFIGHTGSEYEDYHYLARFEKSNEVWKMRTNFGVSDVENCTYF